MADDIVTRLRNAEAPKDGSELLCDLADEAADEIERLRAMIENYLNSDPMCWICEEGGHEAPWVKSENGKPCSLEVLKAAYKKEQDND